MGLESCKEKKLPYFPVLNNILQTGPVSMSKLILVIIIAFGFNAIYGVVIAQDIQISQSDVIYQCPPCGCAHDHEKFDSPGLCPTCNMPLIRQHDGVLGEMQVLFAPVFKNDPDFVPLYNKALYPAFFIGVIIGIFMLVRRRRNYTSVFFSLIVISLALYGLKNQMWGVSYSMGMDNHYLHTPISFITIIGPCLFWFAKTYSDPNFDFRSKDLVHLIPASIFFLFQLSLFFGDIDTRESFMYSPFNDYAGQFEQVLFVLGGSIYAIFAIKGSISTLNTNYKKATLLSHWPVLPVIFMMVFMIFWGIVLIINFALYEMSVATLTYNPLWIVMAALVYWLCFQLIFNEKLSSNESNKVYTNRLTNDLIQQYKNQLHELMTVEKPYLQHELSLSSLSGSIQISSKDLSEVLNKGFGKNFYEYVNEYRVNEVKTLLVDPKYQHLTNTAIASEAGFKSRSTFLSTFKKKVNMTPKEYKNAYFKKEINNHS